MTDDLMTTGVKLLQGIRKILGNTAVGIDGSFDLVTRQYIHDPPDAGFATVFAVSERCEIRFVAAFAVLRISFKRLESDEKTDGDFCIVG
jgi:hypothetical protein